jgi:hypothetical protein
VSGVDVLLDLAPGAALVLDGAEWVVERVEPQYGRAVLVSTRPCLEVGPAFELG